jgi:multiple sugar transport system substrate-binding protein
MRQFTIGAVSEELPDVGMVDNPDHASFASMGIFEDITDRFNAWEDNQFLEGPMNSTILDGRIYGVPWASNCLALWYNVEMFEAAGLEVPETWSELEEVARALTEGDVLGLAISAIGHEEGTFQYLPWLLSSGGDINQMDSAGSIESMEFLLGLVEDGLMSREIINWTQADAQAQFAAERAAMMINGPWQFAAMESAAPDLEFGIARVPRADDGVHASVLGGENLVITRVGNVEASWEFVQWMSSPENSVRFNIGRGTFSPRSDIDNEAVFADDPFMLAFAEALPDAQPRGPHPRWPEISNAISTALHEVLTGQKDVATAMADAQATINEVNEE